MTPRKKKFIFRKKKGTALLFAIITVPLILILAVSFIGPISSSYQAATADQKRLLASAVADNLFEQALLETKDLPIGSNAEGILQPTDIGYGEASGKWWVLGQPETDTEHQIGNKYYVPSLGTGDAGGDYCSSANPVYDDETLGNALVSLTINPNTDLGGDPAEWPCNWGKIKEGESVVIPLYSIDENGDVMNPTQLGLTDFELRIRSACNPDVAPSDLNGKFEHAYDGEICNSTERYTVAGDPATGTKTVIVLWEISGEELDESGVSTGRNIVLGPLVKGLLINTNITVNNINTYTNINKNITHTTKTMVQLDTCDWETIGPNLLDSDTCPTNSKINKPVLKFMVIHSLKDTSIPTSKKIPYLEYQFRSTAISGTPPISNSSKIVKVEVMVDGGYSETIEKTIALPKPITGFVIQQ